MSIIVVPVTVCCLIVVFIKNVNYNLKMSRLRTSFVKALVHSFIHSFIWR